MPAKLPNTIKSLVIQQWLQGKPRNNIAAENGLSSGAVTNIVNEWRHNLGFAAADELRELAVTLRKVGVTAAQCGLGFRIATMMLKIGIKEDSFECFILDIYNRCKEIGLSPDNITDHLKDLLEFSKTTLPLSQISNYIKQKADEKRKLEEKIGKLNEQIGLLQREISDIGALRDAALKNERMTVSELKWYSDIKAELAKYGILVDDITEFAKIVDGLRQYGYDPGRITTEFSDYESHINRHKMFQGSLQALESKYNNLNQQCSFLESQATMHSQTIAVYEQLKAMGFGLKELKLLWNTINEIAVANNIPLQEAPQRFYKDIEEQYDNRIGFESKVEGLRAEVNMLRKEQAKLRTDILLNPLIGSKLVKLTQSGVSEQDIINIAAVFEKSAADRESFISDLEKYAGLKSATQTLTQEVDGLKKQAALLKARNQDLALDSQRILSRSIQSRQIDDFLQGTASSLRNEIIGLVSICAIIIYLLKSPLQEAWKSQVNQVDDEFAALSRSREEAIPIKELKKAVARAIEVLLNKLDTNDAQTADLFTAYAALME